jgi:hypothetical protein
LDPTRPPEVQHSKIVINYDKRELIEYFHYSENSIRQVSRSHKIDDLRQNENSDKDVVRSEEEQKKKKLSDIIRNCVNDILSQEATAIKEMEEIFTDEQTEKTIFDKARERAKKQNLQQSEEGSKEEEDDYLAPVLAKLQLEPEFRDYKKGTPFTEEQAKRVQSEAFQMHKERIKARAKIIQERLDKEVNNIREKFVSTIFIIPSLE